MKSIINFYKEIIGILLKESPILVFGTLVSALLTGFLVPISIQLNSLLINNGILVATGERLFHEYISLIIFFVIISLLPIVSGDLFIYGYIMPRCKLIFRGAYKGKMIRKLEKLQYNHFENAESIEIIDKAYNRIEDTALSLFPSIFCQTISNSITVIGTLILFASIKWWLIVVILCPFIVETIISKNVNEKIYNEKETYWKREKEYTALGRMLQSGDYVKQNKTLGNSEYLINIYANRLKKRNQEYEKFYIKNVISNFGKQNITIFAQIMIAIFLLFFYIKGEVNIGATISLTLATFNSLYTKCGLNGMIEIIRKKGKYSNDIQFYQQYFHLSEEKDGNIIDLPTNFEIEFEHVTFTYPGSQKPVLNDISFKIQHCQTVSFVGRNGEGKSTIIKLMMGLFQPDKGTIYIGGVPLYKYSQDTRTKLFGTIFQDFTKYQFTLEENIGIGNVDKVNDKLAIDKAIKLAKVDQFLETLDKGGKTIIGNEFEGGQELSGGQWQRIALARAFMGDRPILILDEPTSQLDPMAESEIYGKFAKISEKKTAIFITHRLGISKITDYIFVIAEGEIIQRGTHNDLMSERGVYAEMYESQKRWYIKDGE